ncbi:MAG: aminotransferase class I/II-fold pyridoxal phosphate-dependent enzyme [Myxococcota bacterium]|nr:aminotransferase class I/II-fold pyridoxal phosphate-dependent enzyme [Myxococcota bacterium]
MMGRAERTPLSGESAEEIAASAEDAVRRGALRPGEGLPTVRGLAARLGVSPTTVAAAYRALRQRGVVVTAGRRGTRVSPAPPLRAAPAPLPPGVRDLASGNPDPALLPDLRPFLRRLEPRAVLYTDAPHDPELLALARKDFAADALPAEHLAVTSGALDGIERVLAAWLRPGDPVALEDPAFTGVLHLVRAGGYGVLPVAVDDEGPRPEALRRALRAGARAFVWTPRAQNPTGAALSPARGRALAAVLRDHPDLLLVEDDHASVAAGVAARTLCRGRARFAVVRSVSKTLGPDLRLAVLSGDATSVDRVSGRQLLGMRWVSHLLQALVVQLWRDPGVRRHLTRAATTMAARREALLAALADRGVEAHGRSGLNVWVPVPEETAVVQRLAAAGWAVRAGEVYRLESPPGVRVTTAGLPEAEAPAVADALADALRPARAGTLA